MKYDFETIIDRDPAIRGTGKYRIMKDSKGNKPPKGIVPLDADQLKAELSDPDSLRSRVLAGYRQMLKIRKQEDAFSPNSPQQVLKLDERVFALLRGTKENQILVLINVSDDVVELKTGMAGSGLLSGKLMNQEVTLEPYEYLWMKINS